MVWRGRLSQGSIRQRQWMGLRASPLNHAPDGGFNLSNGAKQRVGHERAHPAINDREKVEDWRKWWVQHNFP